jgi:hypothetical protein
VAEARHAFYGAFKVVGRLIRSSATWSETEFSEMAEAYVIWCKHFPRLVIVVQILAPIASAVVVLDKVEKLVAGMTLKPITPPAWMSRFRKPQAVPTEGAHGRNQPS